MNAAQKAAELDKVSAVVQRIGLRPCAWSDDIVHVEEIFEEAPLFVVYPVSPLDGVGEETRCSAADVAAHVTRIRGQIAAKKAGR